MNRLSWLTCFAVLISFSAVAQSRPGDVPPNAVTKDENLLFKDFSCVVKNANNVELKWQILNNPGEGDYFIVERSRDGDHYETVSALKVTDTASAYALTDNSANNGTDFYRIKYTSKGGKYSYSKTLQVSLSADVDFKFYPNPVDKLLIIRTSHNIDIEVLDAAGALRMGKQLQPGIQVVNIASLERGSYILKVTDKESNRVASEQLVKN
ncbi:MAG: hypothetical protein C5B59_07645 [Bacteroidetes bacterium]|nr:MAG: hypothetical protein C5B59_07645 [Bacteroidota bacterium]